MNPTTPPEANSDPREALNAFRVELLQALEIERDYEALAGLMGVEYTPEQAVTELQTTLMLPSNDPKYQLGTTAADVLGFPIADIFPTAQDYMYSNTGWGEDGNGAAFLLIGRNEEGAYFWQAILYAPNGF